MPPPAPWLLASGLTTMERTSAEVRAVEVQGAAAEEDAAVGLGDGEVADVFADLGVGALRSVPSPERELTRSKMLTASGSLALRTFAPPTREAGWWRWTH